MGPVAFEDDVGVQLGYEGVFEAEVCSREDGVEGSEEAALAEVFEDVSED